MFRPSAPTSMSLSGSFALGYVAVSSSATDFTPTMASSENPLSITATFLCRLGLGCRSYNGPEQTVLHRVRSRTFPAHPPRIPCGLRKGYRALVVRGTSPYPHSLPEVRTKLEWQFGAGFLQISHWLSFTGYPSSGRSKEFLRAPLPLPTHSLLSGLWLDFHQLVRDHAGRTRRACLRGPFSERPWASALPRGELER